MTTLYFREAAQPYTETPSSRSGGVWRLPRKPGRGGGWQPGSARRLLARLIGRAREFFHRQHVMSELASLSDRDLADIGISRADIPHIFDANFAVKHAEEFGGRI